MDRDNIKNEVRDSWARILPTMTEEAKQRVNGGTSYICPLCGHGKNGDGLTVNPRSKDGNGLKCFGCGFSGDIIDLYQQTTGTDYNEALSLLAYEIGLKVDAPSERARKGPSRDFSPRGNESSPSPAKTVKPSEETAPADYSGYYAECQENIETQAAKDYLTARGVLGPAIYHGAGYDPKERRIVIPCGSGSYVARSIDDNNPIRYKNPKGARVEIFNESALHAQDVQEVYITEGAFDALSLIEVGAEAIALNSVSNARSLLEKLAKEPTAATLILCLDNDDAGRNATATLSEGLQKLGVPFTIGNICAGHKDPNAALIADRSAFYELVTRTTDTAREQKERAKEEAQRAEQERKKRTGAAMVDAFLQAVTSDKYVPIPTGIPAIDEAIGGGFIRQQLVLLGAAPGAGKTALAQWLFEEIAKDGTDCLYLNLEMSREQMLARSLARIAAQNKERIKVTQILQGYKWNPVQKIVVENAAEEYKQTIAPHMIYNPEEVTADLDSILSYIEAEAKLAEAAGNQAPVVVLDYLQIVRGRDREDDATVIKRAVAALKKFAIDHNTVVFVIIAHNRNANKSGDVSMEAGRDTSALEYSADLQMGLAFTACMKKNGGKDMEDLTPEEKRQRTIRITKGRFGGSGTDVNLTFNGESMTFDPAAPSYREEEAQQSSISRYRGRRS